MENNEMEVIFEAYEPLGPSSTQRLPVILLQITAA